MTIVENVQLARDTYRVRFECPEIARRIVPGQFLMLRLAGLDDPLLGRPLALYDMVLDAAGRPTAIDVVYLVLGKMTARLAHAKPGDELDVWGPLGNGFPPQPTDHLIMVAGGIGQTPFLALGQEYLGRRRYGDPPRDVPPAKKVTLCYGVRTAALAAGVDDFRAAGFDVRLASDDGTLGHHGFVTELLQDALDETRGTDRLVVCCGPEPMMEAVGGAVPRRRGAVPRLARNADGLRHRHLLQLRRQGPPARRQLGLQADLRRRTDLRRGEDRVVVISEGETPTGPRRIRTWLGGSLTLPAIAIAPSRRRLASTSPATPADRRRR